MPAANCSPSGTACSCCHQVFQYICATSILIPSSHSLPVIPLFHSGLDVHVLSSIAFWPHSRLRHATMHTISTLRGSRMRLSLPSTLFILLSLVAGGHAHGGHMDKIPEGAVVSEDPIVRLDQQRSFNGDSNQFIYRMVFSGRTSSS